MDIITDKDKTLNQIEDIIKSCLKDKVNDCKIEAIIMWDSWK